MLTWLLLNAALATTVELPSTAVPADWTRAAELVGVTLDRAEVGPSARVGVVGSRWVVQVVDTEGHRHQIRVAAPVTEAEREDLLHAIKSVAEPVSDFGAPLSLPVVPPPSEPARMSRRSRPRPERAAEPATVVAEKATVDTARPEPPAPPPVDPREVDLSEFGPPRSRRAPGVPRPSWRVVPSLGVGVQVRYGASPRPQLSLVVGAERDRIGLAAGVALMTWGRHGTLGKQRSWTEVAPAAHLYRAGSGLVIGGQVGVAVRPWTDRLGLLTTTTVPQVGGRLGWRTEVSPRLQVTASTWGTLDAGRTQLAVAGVSKGVFHPFSGGLTLEFSRIPKSK